MSEYRAIPMNDKTDAEVFVRARKKFPYNEVAFFMAEGYPVFVPEVNRKTASYARGRLSDMMSRSLGRSVVCFPAIVRREFGYIFKLSDILEVGGREVATGRKRNGKGRRRT